MTHKNWTGPFSQITCDYHKEHEFYWCPECGRYVEGKENFIWNDLEGKEKCLPVSCEWCGYDELYRPHTCELCGENETCNVLDDYFICEDCQEEAEIVEMMALEELRKRKKKLSKTDAHWLLSYLHDRDR